MNIQAHHAEGVRAATKELLTLELFTQNDDGRPVYITGSFNNWMCRDERFQMRKLDSGHYQFHFEHDLLPAGSFEYKYLKGGWEAEELDDDGLPPGNRRMEVPRGRVRDLVPQWKKHAGWYNASFYPDIQVLSTRFHVPQLRRRRRVSVLLPWNYQVSDKKYPVLYLQDGQNLFEDSAPFGTWGVDKQLALLAEKGHGDFIVVAIDHGGKERIKEYLPHPTLKWGDALGREYAEFLRNTLKPYIDANFRTLPGREHTGIGGSSMGGLISLYTGILFPETYSKFMIFSPSLWAAPGVIDHTARLLEHGQNRFFLFVGEKEPGIMVEHTDQLSAHLYRHPAFGKSFSMQYLKEKDAGHNEGAWGRAFPQAASWLYAH